MDKGQYTPLVFIDLKIILDTIDHQILCKKLKKDTVVCLENAWFESYLRNRMQFCTEKDVSSGLGYTNCGVPQGCFLGPLLFLSTSIIFHFLCKIVMPL